VCVSVLRKFPPDEWKQQQGETMVAAAHPCSDTCSSSSSSSGGSFELVVGCCSRCAVEPL
jgi:hypothetical protein